MRLLVIQENVEFSVCSLGVWSLREVWYLQRGADSYQETSSVLVTSPRGRYDPENQKPPGLPHGCQVLPGAPSHVQRVVLGLQAYTRHGALFPRGREAAPES